MCGIAGFYHAGGFDIDAENRLQNMVAVLNHRGPEGRGYHVDTNKGIAMGHTRLSIIDLETGDQPLWGPDHNCVLTTNGEFYDYKRIRAALTCKGARFKTKSDSEIALHLYDRFGLEFVRGLRGEFAVALFDRKERRLILIRDRFGIKPLYYYINDGRIYYASEIKALFTHPAIPREFSHRAVVHQLMHTMIPGTTAYRDIHAVRPGTMLIITARGSTLDIKERQYWDMTFPQKGEIDDMLSEQYFIETVQEKLLEAVSLRLEADVPVGCYLSGGIDSCSMLGLASATQQSPVKAFTISFDHAEYDESAIAREMAERTGADQEVLNLTADDLYGDNYIKTMWHAERTFYNTLGVAKYCMSRRVHDCGYKVVVTGEGSDELFGGYPSFKRDMFLHGLTDEADRKTYQDALEKNNRIFTGAILAESEMTHPAFEQLCGFTPSWIQPWMHTLEIARPLLHDDILADISTYDPIEAIAASFNPGQIEKRHPLDIAQYTWIKTMLECQILNWGGDRVDMANAMESRPAFLDHHVAELAGVIPPAMRINGNVEKWILREAMKDILPEVLYTREKFAFMAPPGHTEQQKRQALDELITAYLNPDMIKDAGLFDVGRLTGFIEEYRTDSDPVSLVRKDALLNHLLGLHILHEQFIKNRVPVVEPVR
ncbi:MAG: asparagine synthase (glutamine-hydrolyzing) [candidate division Zixibacteria bacterium]|nr:asparagine synthase (glutamine-hydrolyzing) [candidate division Zixibacteria bacterium]